MASLKKVSIKEEPKANGSVELLPAIFEPLPGHSDAEVFDSLIKRGASDVQKLAGGFISARAKRSTLEALTSIAHVHQKRKKQMTRHRSGPPT